MYFFSETRPFPPLKIQNTLKLSEFLKSVKFFSLKMTETGLKWILNTTLKSGFSLEIEECINFKSTTLKKI